MKKLKKKSNLKTIEAFRGCTCSACKCSGQGADGNYARNTGPIQAPRYK